MKRSRNGAAQALGQIDSTTGAEAGVGAAGISVEGVQVRRRRAEEDSADFTVRPVADTPGVAFKEAFDLPGLRVEGPQLLVSCCVESADKIEGTDGVKHPVDDDGRTAESV